MMKSTVSVEQIRYLFNEEADGRFGIEGLGPVFQWVADNRPLVDGLRKGVIKLAKPTVFPTTYDCSLGLVPLIQRAVGDRNCGNINSDITQEHFPLNGVDVRQVNLQVEPFLHNETGEEAAKRLTAVGHTLANTGDLAGFLHDHPKEVEKWAWVLAISEDSRWACRDGGVMVPYAIVDGADRYFRLGSFRRELDSDYGVLVSSEPASTCR